MNMNEDDEQHIFTKEKAKYRTVKYHQHGILREAFNSKAKTQVWTFDCSDLTQEFEGGVNLVTLLDDLSKEGYELVCGSGDEYILRTKIEVEETEAYWDTEDL